MAAPWHARAERGSSLGMRGTVWLYRLIGRRGAGLLLYPIVAYFLITDSAGRRASRDYLGRLARAGAHGLEPRPGYRALFRHYLEFGRQILDRVGFWIGTPDEFAIDVRGMEQLDRVAAERRGALVLGSHLGSFDAMRLIAQLRSPIAVSVVMYTRHAARINALLDPLASRSPSAPTVRILGVPVVQSEGSSISHALEIKRRVDAGEVVALLADRTHPNEQGRVAPADFFGAPAAFPQGPWLLANALGCPVLLMTALRCADRRYEVHVERLADRIVLPRRGRAEAVATWCQKYADHLAVQCLSAPYQWFNFYPFWEKAGSVARS